MISIIFNKIVNRNPRDFIFTGSYSLPFIGIFNIREQILFIQREAVGGGFFADLLHGFSDHFKDILFPCGVVVSWLLGVVVSWCRGITVSGRG